MRKCVSIVCTFTAGAALFLIDGERAAASLLASFNLNQGVYEDGSPFFGSTKSTPVYDTSMPFQQTVTQTTSTNGVTTAYSAYDNGASAGITISSSAYITALNNDVGEGTLSDIILSNTSSTTFSFTQPVNYTIGYQITGTSYGGGFQVSSPNGYIIRVFQPPTFVQSGTMSPNVSYTLTEFWGLNNINNSNPANLSGSESISLTFTAIPEPTSFSLLVIPLALLSRRRGKETGT